VVVEVEGEGSIDVEVWVVVATVLVDRPKQ
jgi:hypothetical protein